MANPSEDLEPPVAAPSLEPASRPTLSGQAARVVAAIEGFLARIDPNDDPAAEPLGLAPVLAFAFFVSVSCFLYLRFQFHAMQDVGHHLAMSAVVADWGRPGSIYTSIYTKPDLLNPNSLLYACAGTLGRFIGVGRAVRAGVAFYLAGVPLATLWGLRVLGRSAWPAVLSVVFTYCMSYVAGFTNFVFAAPFLVLGVPLFYRMLRAPSWGRIAAFAVVATLTFLAHVHVYLWLGVIAFAMTLVAFAASVVDRVRVPRRTSLPSPDVIAAAAFVSVAPSLALLARWAKRATSPPSPDEYVTSLATSSEPRSYASYLKSADQLLHDLPGYLKTLKSDDDLRVLFFVFALFVLATLLRRGERSRTPPVLEGAALLSLASYFVLPEHTDGQAVIGSRQLGIALWFAPVFFAPVSARRSRLARWVVIAGIVLVTRAQLKTWAKWDGWFQQEAKGLREVLDAAPPKLRLNYVNLAFESDYYPWNAWWHVDKWYMAEKLGNVDDNPAFGIMNPIRFKASYTPHRVTIHVAGWPSYSEIWQHHDLVLVHKWQPTPAQVAEAEKHGTLLRRSGDWEIWQKKP